MGRTEQCNSEVKPAQVLDDQNFPKSKGRNLKPLFTFLVVICYTLTIHAIFKTPDIISDLQRRGVDFDISVFLWLIPSTLLSVALYQLCDKDLMYRFESCFNVNENWDENKRHAFLHGTSKYLAASIFYFFSSLINWFWVLDKARLPKIFGGNFEATHYYLNWPVQNTKSGEYFCIFVAGHHFDRFITHLITERGSDRFLQFQLHHVIAFMLIYMCIVMQQTEIGLVMLLLNDISDFVYQLLRVVKNTRLRLLLKINAFGLLGIWGWTRVYSITVEVFWGNIIGILKQEAEVFKEFIGIHIFVAGGLFMLTVLNILWFWEMSVLIFAGLKELSAIKKASLSNRVKN